MEIHLENGKFDFAESKRGARQYAAAARLDYAFCSGAERLAQLDERPEPALVDRDLIVLRLV